MSAPDVSDPRFVAAIDLIGRSGAKDFQIRYQDDDEPTVWIAGATYEQGYECDAALDPLTASLRLAERLIDGGTCVHCHRVTGVWLRWEETPLLQQQLCWYVYDPELQKFCRSCEGDAKVNRSDPCPCGSGEKFKRCHGSGRG